MREDDGHGIRHSATAGVAWVGLQSVVLQGLTLLTQLLLARLLAPDLFGIVAIAAAVQMIGSALAGAGLAAAVIRQPEIARAQLVTATRLSAAFGLIVAIGVAATAPLFAQAFGQPELAEVLPVYAVTIALGALQVVPIGFLQRSLRFGTILLLQLPAAAAGAAVAIALALVHPSIWALAAQPLVSALVLTAVLVARRRVLLIGRGDPSSARPMLRFGLPLAGSNVLDAVWSGLPAFFILATSGPVVAGLYFVADRLRTGVVSVFFQTISTVAFPALSAASARDRLRAATREATRASVALLVPALLVLTTQTDNVFAILLGPEWAGGAPFASIMFLGALMYPLNAISISVMSVRGRSGLILGLEIVKRAAALAALLWVLPFGVEAYLWAMAGLAVLAYVPNSWYAVHAVGYRYRDQLSDVALPVGIGLVSAGLLVAIDTYTSVPGALVLWVIAPVVLLGAWALVFRIDRRLRRVVSDVRGVVAALVPSKRPRAGEAGQS